MKEERTLVENVAEALRGSFTVWSTVPNDEG